MRRTNVAGASEQPVSRQQEIIYHGYYGTGAALVCGASACTRGRSRKRRRKLAFPPRKTLATLQRGDSHLRDSSVVRGYHIRAADGDIGHIDDFIVGDRNWRIRYLLVDPSNWLGGRHVLVSPDWVRSVSWEESRVHVALPRDAIRNSPEYDARQIPTREYEHALYAHYERAGYWRNDDVRARGSRHPDQAPPHSVAARSD